MFNMGIPILVKRHPYIETAPDALFGYVIHLDVRFGAKQWLTCKSR